MNMKLPFTIDLSEKVAVVTGGAGVLCGTFASALAACGARVAVLDIDLAKAEKAAASIRAGGGMALGVGASVLDRVSLMTAEEHVRTEFGPCDILINGAGGNHPKGTTSMETLDPEALRRGNADLVTFFDLDAEGIQFVFNLNFLGTLLPTQAFARSMVDRGGGAIVNISSMNAFKPLTKIPAYSGAKAAVSNFTQWLAVHFSRCGIRVNAMAPGFFLTEQNRALLIRPDGTLNDRAAKIMGMTPLGRFGKPGDLIGTLLWLVDDNASGFVTGTVIPVDGGFSAYAGV